MNFISKLFIRHNLSNIFKFKNWTFFLYSILKFKYRKMKMKSKYTTF